MKNVEKVTQIETACANTILGFFLKNGQKITHMKLQKLYFFSAGDFLAKNKVYIASHLFQAWPYGPVLPKLYSKLSDYKDRTIENYIYYDDGAVYSYTEKDSVFSSIEKICDTYYNSTAWELSERSHDINGPWFKTVVSKKEYWHDISLEVMMECFKENGNVG